MITSEQVSFDYRLGRYSDMGAMALVLDRANAPNDRTTLSEDVPDQTSRITIDERLTKWFAWSYVASHSGRIVGFAIGYPSSEEASLAYDPTVEYLSLLMVEPNIWRNGVGGKLLELSAQHSRDASKSSLALWTGLNNIRARRFYERSGCRQTNLGRISERHGPMVQYVLDLYK